MPKSLKFSSVWPFFAIFILVLIFFYPVWTRGLVPIPADITVGLYYPWLDYKWGYTVGVPVKNNLPSDIVSVHLPFRMFAAEQLQQGHIPLWNNLILSGTPLVANFQSAVFYPLNLLLFFLSTIDAWTLQIILQPLLAAVFSYLLLRHWKLSKLASLFGAIAFAFSGFSLVWLEYNIHGHTAYWLPAILLVVDKYLKNPKKIYGVFLSLFIALAVFAGYPQLVLYEGLAVAIFLAFHLKVKEFAKKFVGLTFFALSGILLASVQLFPGAELLFLSNRAADAQTIAIANQGFLPVKHLIGFFTPDYFGNPATGNFWGTGFYDNFTGYTGLVSLVLAVVAFFFSWKKTQVKFLGTLILISLLLALRTPISVLIFETNFLGFQAAIASRALFLTSFSIALLAAFGLDALTKVRWSFSLFRSLYLPIIVLSGVGLGTLVGLFWLDELRPQFIESLPSLEVMDVGIRNLTVGLRNLVLPISGLLLAGFFFAVIRLRFAKPFVPVGLFLILIFELFRFGHKYLTFARRELIFPRTPVIEFLVEKYKKDGPFRVLGGDVVPMNMLAPYGLETASGYDALYPVSYARFLAKVNSEDENQPRGRYGDIQRFDSELLDIANVRYILALKRDDKSSPDPTGKPSYLFDLEKFTPVFEDGTVLVLENKGVLPRAFFEANGKVQDADISYLKYSPQHNILAINAPNDGVLVVSEQYYPGWKALVDEQEVPILPRYEVFRGVGVSSGKHIIEFIYEPKSYKIGKWISFATGLFLVALVLYEKFTTNKSRKIA